MSETFEDPAKRLDKLVAAMEPKFRARFLAVVATIKDQMSLEQIAKLLQAGLIDEALVTAEVAALRMSSTFTEAFIISGDATAVVLGDALNIIVEFDHLNRGALDVMTRNKLRLVEGFMEEQKAATREALIDGIQRGLNPIEQARNFRDSIGLTQYQQQIVNNYRRQLEALDRDLFDRALRDKRFDSTVRRAIENGTPLSQAQINHMVQRYTDKWVKYRSEVIARTESLRSVHAGNNEMYRQAVERGDLDGNDLVRTWDTSGRANVRDSHRAMHGQQRKMGELFLSGNGNALEYPGDDRAPASDTAQCVCAVTTRFSNAAKEAANAVLTSATPF